MAGEQMIPLLPCPDIDQIAAFYAPLGFRTTYHQQRPNPYIALAREDIHLHYFGLDGLQPEASYSSCLVVVDDTQPLFDAFAAGLRTVHGRLPLTGYPRITRPRRRKNAGYLSGFSLIDPAGNWIRIIRRESAGADKEPPTGPLTAALDNAVVLADSHGDVAQAHKILAGALRRHTQSASPQEQAPVLAYLAELALRLDDTDEASRRLSSLEQLALASPADPVVAGALTQARELAES